MVIQLNDTKQDLKQKVGLVLQDPFIFYGTIFTNIKLYHPTMTFEQVKMQRNLYMLIVSSIN